MSATSPKPVRLTLGATDDPESERALNVLQRDLASHSQLHVRRDVMVSETVESDTKGAIAEVALLVSTSVSGLSVLGKVINEWIRAKAKRSLKVTIGSDSIELSGAPPEALERALNDFLALHSSQLFDNYPDLKDSD